MLVELAVRELGVIGELALTLGPGMTALTGETGAGKTLVVDAIELLVGGRAEGAMVRPGASEARIEGRFVTADDREVVLARVVLAAGRSRAYVDGHLAPVSALGELGAGLVDLHGQHAHQSLLRGPEQRALLDRFGSVDVSGLTEARHRLAELEAAAAGSGGDPRSRAREVDLLRHQIAEIDGAGLDDVEEEDGLRSEQNVLADATAHREAARSAHAALLEEGGGADGVAAALGALAGRPPFAELEARLRAVAAEVAEAGADARAVGESITADPERLEAVRARLALLRELRRKYGDRLGDVVAYVDQARARLAELVDHEARCAALDAERSAAEEHLAAVAATVAAARAAAAPMLARAVAAHLGELAMPGARVELSVEGQGGEDVTILLGANPGEPVMPLAKVASGGELARAMLALRLALLSAPTAAGPAPGPAEEVGRTLVFDEVDAGIGGQASLAVGRALSALAGREQVLVVTHLPQVAAFADAQVAVAKVSDGGRTSAGAQVLDEAQRVVELSRMLSGQPESGRARDHAEELLSVAARQRGR